MVAQLPKARDLGGAAMDPRHGCMESFRKQNPLHAKSKSQRQEKEHARSHPSINESNIESLKSTLQTLKRNLKVIRGQEEEAEPVHTHGSNRHEHSQSLATYNGSQLALDAASGAVLPLGGTSSYYVTG